MRILCIVSYMPIYVFSGKNINHPNLIKKKLEKLSRSKLEKKSKKAHPRDFIGKFLEILKDM